MKTGESRKSSFQITYSKPEDLASVLGAGNQLSGEPILKLDDTEQRTPSTQDQVRQRARYYHAEARRLLYGGDGDLRRAIEACDQSINLYMLLVEASPDDRNDLARAHMNRGVAQAETIGPRAAIPDLDQAIRLMEAVRDEPASASLRRSWWTKPIRFSRSTALAGRLDSR
jgi:hypothetical protein